MPMRMGLVKSHHERVRKTEEFYMIRRRGEAGREAGRERGRGRGPYVNYGSR